jgi:hypothetical protein
VDNVVEFRKAKSQPVAALKVAEQKSPPKLTTAMSRREWTATLAQIWANPRNWRRSKKTGSAYIVIDDLEICVVITHGEHGFRWEIRWNWSNEPPIKSRWVYMAEQTAINEAWDALVAVG